MVDEVGVCNSVFLLELGCAAETGAVSTGNRQRRQRESSMKLEPFMLNPVVPELSLTLGLSDTAFRQLSSATASLSASSNVKKEAEAGSEEAEKISARGSEDEDENGSRKKLRLTKEQSALLEEKFREHSTLNPKQKLALAKQLNLRPRQVEVWFQNRRARTKLKQTEVDCEFLRRCCESLTEENRRLHRELQELKAVQVPAAAAPLYMQLPPAMLKICPSCERVAGGNDRSKDSALAAASAAVTKKALFLNPFSHSTACWE